MSHDSPDWVPLVDYRRNEIPECTIHGAIAWVHGTELVHSWGGNVVCYGRSMMKPLMMKVFIDELDEVLSWEQKAITVASHNGDTEHTRAVLSILTKGELRMMQTPQTVPLVQFGKQKRRPRRWYHCCSGEHAGILRGCKLKGWSRVGYTWPHHPFFVSYMEEIQKRLDHNWKVGQIAKDGCGLPTVSMEVNDMARLFAALAVEKDDDWIWPAMVRHPDLVGGFNRLDSTIIKSCDGQVIAKEGADGLLGLSVRHPDYPKGLGIVVKVAHGWNSQASWFVARWALGVLGFSFRNPYALERQKAFIVPDIVPAQYREAMKDIEPWDSWDPDRDRWYFDPTQYAPLGDG